MKSHSHDCISILCICIHNSARSQMAEAYLSSMGGAKICAQSAGLERGTLNPYVVDVLREDGIDIGRKRTQTVDDVMSRNEHFDIVITVCDDAAKERCPMYFGSGERLHWPFPDPSAFTGTSEEILAKTREVRDAIKEKVKKYLATKGI